MRPWNRTVTTALARRVLEATRFASAAALAAVVVAASAAPALATAPTVTIERFAFNPPTITVHVGDTVTWQNLDADHHNVRADDASFVGRSLAQGASYTRTFTAPGTVAYHCGIHPEMTASIVVQAVATPPTTDTAPVADADDGSGGTGLFLIASLIVALLTGRWISRRAGRRSL